MFPSFGKPWPVHCDPCPEAWGYGLRKPWKKGGQRAPGSQQAVEEAGGRLRTANLGIKRDSHTALRVCRDVEGNQELESIPSRPVGGGGPHLPAPWAEVGVRGGQGGKENPHFLVQILAPKTCAQS